MDQRPNVRANTVQLLGENIGVILHDPGFGNCFLAMSPKAQATKEKIHKLDFIKKKNFCASNDIIRKVKKQHREWGKIFENHASDKKLYLEI